MKKKNLTIVITPYNYKEKYTIDELTLILDNTLFF